MSSMIECIWATGCCRSRHRAAFYQSQNWSHVCRTVCSGRFTTEKMKEVAEEEGAKLSRGRLTCVEATTQSSSTPTGAIR